jgi:predicted amidohydrolase YtcJ
MSPADLVVTGARIRTLDPARPWATAVAVRDGVLVAVGGAHDVADHTGPRTVRIDAGGRSLVPGLVDGHAHPLWGSTLARGVALDGLRDADAVARALRDEAERVGPGGWVFGWGLDPDVFATRRLEPRVVADAVGAHPALVRSADGHSALASPRALTAAGVDGPVAFEDGSEVVLEDGRPTGLLLEMTAIALVASAAPALTPEEQMDIHASTLGAMNAVGLTGAHVMDGDDTTPALLRRMEDAGRLSARLVVPVWLQPGVDDATVERFLSLRDDRGRRWRGGVAKFFADGVIDTGTAWLEEPDTAGESTRPFWPDPTRYRELVTRFAQAGFQCVTHAIGDRAVRDVLDAYAAAGGAPGMQHRVEHLETTDDALVARFADAGVVPSMQPIHLRYVAGDGSGTWEQRLGPERAARAFRTRDLLDAAGTLVLGSDWPIAPFDPRLGMAAAQLRREPSGTGPAVVPDQALTGLEALHGYTTACAAAVGESHLGGRIAIGLRADLTGFAADPAETAPADLPELPVWLTVVDGEVVHRAGD